MPPERLRLPDRVLFVSHDGRLGGAQLALADSVRALTAAGTQVHVALPWGRHPRPLQPLLRQAGAHVHRGPVGLWAIPPYGKPRRRGSTLRGLTLAGIWLALLARRFRVGLIITNTGLVGGGAEAARRVTVAHLWWLHERQERDDPLPFVLGLEDTRRRIAIAGQVAVPSSFLAQECEPWVVPGRLHRLPPVAATTAALSAHALEAACSAVPRTILFPGGLQSVKRPMDAVLALSVLREKGTDYDLSVVGYDGAERPAVESAVSSHGLEQVVTIKPFASSLAAHLVPGCVLVSAGLHETFGRVLVEAMTAGVPVVAANAGASPELIDNGRTGLLFEPGDHGALAAALTRLREDAPWRASLIRAAHEEAHRRFSAEAHLMALAAAWESAGD